MIRSSRIYSLISYRSADMGRALKGECADRYRTARMKISRICAGHAARALAMISGDSFFLI